MSSEHILRKIVDCYRCDLMRLENNWYQIEAPVKKCLNRNFGLVQFFTRS